MAKINTLNYQTVASWNGSQDLFVVEQPDGTKVATPAMVKQFMEAGDFVATGEVKDGHGNILADMAKSADVNTALAGKQDTLTFDNVPTENSSNPVKSGGVYSSIKFKKVPNSFITLESGISITTNQLFKQGNHIFGWITFSFSAQTPNNLKLGTLNTGYTTNYMIRMIAGLGTEAWASEHMGYAVKGTDNGIYINGYNNNIKSAHIHLDYVV